LLWAALLGQVQHHRGVAPMRILDCGGGSGSLAVPLAGLGTEVTVVDVSIDALGTLVRRAAEAGVSEWVTAVQGEAETLTSLLSTAGFDMVLAHELLETVSGVPSTLSEIAAVLRADGVASIVVANPVAGVLGRALSGDVAGALALVQRPGHEVLDLATLEAHCLAAGLYVDSVDGIGVFSDLVPGIDLERPGAMIALADLEAATAALAPYRDIASRLHVMARRADAADR
jgi:S-adenosylmethionine-dependent methyltransferase